MRRVAVIAMLIAFAIPSSAFAADPCQPYEGLLSNPYVERVSKCVFSLERTLSSPERRDFARKLSLRALSDSEHGNSGPGTPLSYSDLAELVALLDKPELVSAFLDFIAKHPESADETRSFAIARLYELRTPILLEQLSSRSEADRKVITWSIAWGLANNFYLFINLENYRRLSVGSHWEVLEPEHPHRALSKKVEEQLREILERSSAKPAA